jgi:CHAD domain-containing protein
VQRIKFIMKTCVKQYILPATFDIEIIDPGYHRGKLKKLSGVLRYYDTFDRRLCNQGWELTWFKNEVVLREADKQQIQVRAESQTIPVFVKDFPAGILKEKLTALIDVRALLVIAEMPYEQQQICFTNAEQKVVLRFTLEKYYCADRKEAYTIGTVAAIKGYGLPFRQLTRWFTKQKYKTVIKQVYALITTEKRPYSSKIELQFNRQTSPYAAAGEIFNLLTTIMEDNEAGIIDDIDTEFLHDFRVSIRRIRSALNQFKRILKPSMLHWANNTFSELGHRTNPLRDLDVYLLKQAYYNALLPADYQPHLLPFFEQLKKQRKGQFETLTTFLKSPEYQQIKDRWKIYINELAGTPSDTLICNAAHQWIGKRLQRVLKFGRQLDKQSPDRKLHLLRIASKKLRYLLEFFSSLYPGKRINPIIKRLKGLQDQLGVFNDNVVQQQKLRLFVQQCSGETRRALRLLINRLGDQHEKERVRCFKVIRNFTKSDFSIFSTTEDES